jgi:hypothetical protein
MIQQLLKFFKKNKKIEPPEEYAIIKMSPVAQEAGLTDDENKIIEVNSYGKITILKYTESDVEVLRENGIPVIHEDYTDDYQFVNSTEFGGVESYRR